MSIVITGATGQLGGLVIQNLLGKKVPANQIVAVVRNVEKASALAELGVELRQGDYNDQASLEKAFAGAAKLLFIPSPDAHDETLRMAQHTNVVQAAKSAKVGHILYYGFAFGEESKLVLAPTHVSTENLIRNVNIPYTFLRNSLYTDVFVNPQSVGAAVQFGALITNAGDGRVNTASRSDLALAGAVVLTQDGHENKSYNLVASETWSFGELARVISEVSGKQVVYQSVSFDEQKGILLQAGLPEPVAALFAGIYQEISQGETSKTSDDLKNLIGTLTPLNEIVKQALQG
ncbi:SDR family oxidoreductase [Paenibacillus sedimenti]|uniref:SDR family oxidoreductase n=1 Tax=Paenibacillus sedimenti TaxID=2770274 RepID=A0A926KKH5_9BACL|nr:SDR family oxidoreductase [Paenibacillus sedimenti]MBD0379444.1 SDR family oxidoreductase [Paenibacillus sedimenti]